MTTPTFTMGPAILFCPADRPERFAKAAERADAVILDLEDAVAPDAKPAAREHIAAADLDPATTVVRVNDAASPFFEDDLAAVRDTPFRTVMLAKAESAEQVRRVTDALPDARVIALCETAAGIVAASEIAEQSGVVALMWGAEDLVASLGGRSSRRPDGSYRDVAVAARAAVLLAAGAHGKAAIDAVHVDIADTEGLAAEAEDAAGSGFAATACIHPGQVAVIREAYLPTAEAVDYARRLLAAAEGAPGVFRFEGHMIDGPLLRHAERTVAQARRADTLGTDESGTETSRIETREN